MSLNVLLTGVSGYLGGDLLTTLENYDLPPHGTIYALIRTDEQANSVKNTGITPLRFDTKDAQAVENAILQHELSIVFFLVDALKADTQGHFIRALAKLKTQTGKTVHFLHTSGAKIFSSHAGAPSDRPLLDTDPELFRIQKSQKPPIPPMQSAIDANNTVISLSEELGVRSYIFVPCIVYGKGSGFGNPISIQTVAIVKAATVTRRMWKVDDGRPSWPVCHVKDNTTLFLDLLSAILNDKNPPHGENGYYLASPGSVAWEDIYAAMAKHLFAQGKLDSPEVERANDAALENMGQALGWPKDLVSLQLGGLCTFTARRATESLGWKPQYPKEHILEVAGEECDLILENLKYSKY
jgi:nucleoside-diphosphate-sugar epimerase